MRVTYCFLVVCFFIHSGWTHAQDEDSSTGFDVSVTESLFRPAQARFHAANFDLGRLPSNTEGVVTLTVKNPTAEPFQFTKISRSCNCVSIIPDKNVIPAGGSTEFRMKLKTPEFAKRETVFAVVTLSDESDQEKEVNPSISLRLNYQLAGFIYIEREMIALDIPESDESAELRIPFLITKPITTKQLAIDADEALNDISFDFDGEGNDIFASAFVPIDLVADGPVSGQVTIFDKVSKREDTIFVILRKVSDYKLSPSLMRFTRDGGQAGDEVDSNVFSARVLIRRPKTEKKQLAGNPETPLGSANSKFRVEASISGVPCRVETQAVSTRIVKARVWIDVSSLPTKTDDAASELVDWKIYNGQNEISHSSSRFVFIE
jgi:hypothetical protein